MIARLKHTSIKSANLFFSQLPNTGLPILLYHSVNTDPWINSIDPHIFDQQMFWISKHYQPITLTDLSNWLYHKKPLPPRPICITFDDGFKDNYQIAFPIMNKYHLVGNLFLVANKNFQPVSNLPLLNNQEVNKLIQSGWKIGSHTCTHPILPKLTQQQITTELDLAKKQLRKQYQKRIEAFAYPKGRYNSQVTQMTKKHYRIGLTTDWGFASPSTDPYLIPRITIMKFFTLETFKLYLTPALRLVPLIQSIQRPLQRFSA